MGSASSNETTEAQPDDRETETADVTENRDSLSAGSKSTSGTESQAQTTTTNDQLTGTSPTEESQVPPDSDLEVLRALDAFLDDIDTDLPTARERARARDHFELEDRLGGKTTTQSTLASITSATTGLLLTATATSAC
ncbi:hypothetical protein [Haloarcula amylovorans]|uniref:hypothetical protein n=1 Tax=Haloarcula amylovorans TaxID=2562280 RepID=UPI001ADDA210|nr:hypothetical protein [Halomicroarcula amylolytica]